MAYRRGALVPLSVRSLVVRQVLEAALRTAVGRVPQRTGEIGVRVALGAQRPALLWMVLSDALRLVGIGVLLGALYFGVQYVQHMLYGISAFDPITLVITAALLTVVALA